MGKKCFFDVLQTHLINAICIANDKHYAEGHAKVPLSKVMNHFFSLFGGASSCMLQYICRHISYLCLWLSLASLLALLESREVLSATSTWPSSAQLLEDIAHRFLLLPPLDTSSHHSLSAGCAGDDALFLSRSLSLSLFPPLLSSLPPVIEFAPNLLSLCCSCSSGAEAGQAGVDVSFSPSTTFFLRSKWRASIHFPLLLFP